MTTPAPQAAQHSRQAICIAHVHPGDYALIERAAQLQQMPVDEFVLLAAFRTAQEAISEFEARPFQISACAHSHHCTAHQHGCTLAQGCAEHPARVPGHSSPAT